MGADIHPILEIRPRGSKEKFIQICGLADMRNYTLFGYLSGVRGDFEEQIFRIQDTLPEDTSVSAEVLDWGHSLTVMPFDKLSGALDKFKILKDTDAMGWVKVMRVFEKLGMETRVIAWYDS